MFCDKSGKGGHSKFESSFVVRQSFWEKKRKEKAYADLQRGYAPLTGIDRSLNPHYDLYTGEIEITTPSGKKERYKTTGFFGNRYEKVEKKGFWD